MEKSKKLQGKVAIVSGASKGIGASIAKYLAEEGAAVVVNYSSSKKDGEKIVAEITKNGGKAVAVQANVSKPDDIHRLVAETIKTFGKLDILVNNAGIYEFAPLEDITPEFFYKMFDLNVLGLLLLTKEAVKHFKKGGSVINISSIASKSVSPETSVYSATKASVDAITQGLSKELAPRHIRVNSINPGMIETEGLISTGIRDSDFAKNIEGGIPLGRLGQPNDIAPMAVFLASDEASWITGQTFFITGGAT